MTPSEEPSRGAAGRDHPARLRLSILLLLFALHLALRLIGMSSHTQHIDEVYSTLMAERPVAEIWRLIHVEDPHPPVHYLLMKGWMSVGRMLGAVPPGTIEPHYNVHPIILTPEALRARTFLRVPGVVFSVLAFWALAALGARLYGPRAVYAALALFAISRLETFWAQSLRYPVLLMLWGLLASLAYARLYELVAQTSTSASEDNHPARRRNLRLWIAAYVLAGIAGLYTNYLMTLVLFSHFLHVVLTRRWAWAWPAAWGAMAAGFAPWLPVFAAQLKIVVPDTYGATAPTLTAIPRLFYRFLFSYGFDMNTLVEGPGAWAGLAVMGVLLFGALRTNRLFVWLYAFVPVAALLLVSLKKPMFNQQYFLICVPGFCLFLGRGAEALWERWGKTRISPAPESN